MKKIEMGLDEVTIAKVTLLQKRLRLKTKTDVVRDAIDLLAVVAERGGECIVGNPEDIRKQFNFKVYDV